MKNIEILNIEGLEFLENLPDDSIDLILTDPPYITSRQSGMEKWAQHVKEQDKKGCPEIKTEKEWGEYKTFPEWHQWFRKGRLHIKRWLSTHQKLKKDYLKYGSIYGKKYAVTTAYGPWDEDFTLEKLNLFVEHFHRVLSPGGTCIIFFDLWKLSYLKEQLENAKFKQLRFIEWIKTNPQPLNSKRN